MEHKKQTLEEVLEEIECFVSENGFYTGYREESSVVYVGKLIDCINEIRKTNGIKIETEDE